MQMATITKQTANKLIRSGAARLTDCNGVALGTTTDERGHVYQIVERLDLQRVDHYRVEVAS